VLNIQGWRGPFSLSAVVIGHFAARRDGRKVRARGLLDDAAAKCDTSAWRYPVIGHLRGDLDQSALLAAADDDEKRE
jgi:hypothetical protein